MQIHPKDFETLLSVMLIGYVLGILYDALIWAPKETQRDSDIVYSYTWESDPLLELGLPN